MKFLIDCQIFQPLYTQYIMYHDKQVKKQTVNASSSSRIESLTM